MLNALQQFFNRALAMPEPEQERQVTLELATAALLCEIVRADYHRDPRELETLHVMLRERFALDRGAVLLRASSWSVKALGFAFSAAPGSASWRA